MDQHSPWLSRFLAYLRERFPPVNGALFFIFYLTVLSFVHVETHPDQPLPVNSSIIAGFVAVYFFFFHLRVFDEHKDFATDRIYHPGRVLQRGLIRLTDLKIIGSAAIIFEGLISLWISIDAAILWVICFAYSLLMLKEFFVRQWLSERLVLYAVSHMAIMPLMVLWMASIIAPPQEIPRSLGWIAFLSFFSGMAFEISRKIKAPEDEREGVLTYSKLWTPGGAAFSAWGCLAVSSAVLWALMMEFSPHAAVYGLLILLIFYVSFIFFRFAKSHSISNAKRLELGSSLFMILAYLIVIVLALHQTGIRWS